MGIFANLGSALFGKAKMQPNAQNKSSPITATDVMGMSGSASESNVFDYHFNPVPLMRTPGPAYIAPLLQFQEYPKNLVEGKGGIMYHQSFKSFQPLTETTQNRPVISGTSGITTGQVYFQPLTDTSSNTTAG